MELADAMRTTGAVRRFRSAVVPDDALYRALDAARFAPSGGNRQGWHVIVVRDQELRARLKELYLRSWRPLFQAAQQARGEPDASGRRRPGTVAGNDYAEHLDELPVHLVVLVELAALETPFPAIRESSFAAGSSIYPFVQNLVLALRAEGLGSALTMMLNNAEDDVRALMSIPAGYSLAAHLGVGVPVRWPTGLRRRPVEDFTTVDRFDGASFAGRGPTCRSVGGKFDSPD